MKNVGNVTVVMKSNESVSGEENVSNSLEGVEHPTTSGEPQVLYVRSNALEDAYSQDEERLVVSQPNLRSSRSDFPILGLVNSTGALHHHESLARCARKCQSSVPPSYSAVLKLGGSPLLKFDSTPFIPRQPPPSYAEVHGWANHPSNISNDSYSLGPDPLYVSCPRCRMIVVSDIHTQRSQLAYVISVILCVCLCWPCCLIPFCLKSCRNTYHFCPTCHYYLGVYRPC